MAGLRLNAAIQIERSRGSRLGVGSLRRGVGRTPPHSVLAGAGRSSILCVSVCVLADRFARVGRFAVARASGTGIQFAAYEIIEHDVSS